MPTEFTYSGDPSESNRDEVRFLIGDTIESRPLFDDREIDFQLTKTPNKKIAGAELLENKARQFAVQADVRVGDVSKAFGKVSENMFKAAADLRADANKRALPFFGGLSISGKEALRERSDDVQPQFSIGQNDNPTAAQLNDSVNSLFGLLGGGP